MESRLPQAVRWSSHIVASFLLEATHVKEAWSDVTRTGSPESQLSGAGALTDAARAPLSVSTVDSRRCGVTKK